MNLYVLYKWSVMSVLIRLVRLGKATHYIYAKNANIDDTPKIFVSTYHLGKERKEHIPLRVISDRSGLFPVVCLILLKLNKASKILLSLLSRNSFDSLILTLFLLFVKPFSFSFFRIALTKKPLPFLESGFKNLFLNFRSMKPLYLDY